MASEKFSLCWNNFHSNLSSGFHSLFQGEHLVDVTLAAEGRILKAHKIVLSVCSPYFNELFRVNPCTHPIVILKDVSAAALDQLLTFMYCGEVSVRQDELGTFIKTAEALQIKGLTGHNTSASSTSSVEHEINGVSNIMIDSVRTVQELEQSSNQSMNSKKRPRSKHIPIQPAPLPTFNKSKVSRIEKKSQSNKNTNTRKSASFDSSEDIEEIIARKTCIAPMSPDKMEEEAIVLPVETQIHDTITPKIEPIDFDSYDTSQYSDDAVDNNLDATTLLETKVSYGSNELTSLEVSADEWAPDKSKSPKKSDISVPSSSTSQKESLRFLTSAKGLPVLVYAGHMYTLDESRNNRTTWVCVKRNKLNCHGCVTTTVPSPDSFSSGNIKDSSLGSGKSKVKGASDKEDKLDASLIVSSKIVSYCGHNHSQLNDIIDRIQAKDSVCVTPKM